MFEKVVYKYNSKDKTYTWKPQSIKEWVYYYRYKVGYFLMPLAYQVWLDELNSHICSDTLEDGGVVEIGKDTDE